MSGYRPLRQEHTYQGPSDEESASSMSRHVALGPSAEIADDVQTLSRKNNQLDRILGKLGTRSDTPDLRAKLSTLRGEAKDLCKRTLQALRDSSHDRGTNSSVQRRLQKQFQAQLDKFQRINREIERKEQQIVAVMSHSAQGSSPIAGMTDEEQLVAQQEVDVQFQVYDLEEIRRKEQGIRNIEKDVTEIAEMFRDLDTLVNEQQDNIDTIESNITTARDETAAAQKELVKAEDLQRKARKKQCILLVGILIVIAIIITIVLVATRDKDSDKSSNNGNSDGGKNKTLAMASGSHLLLTLFGGQFAPDE